MRFYQTITTSFLTQLLLRPILDGRAILYSFVYTPEVRIGVAFGSGGSQSLPATELPGVSSWLVKYLIPFKKGKNFSNEYKRVHTTFFCRLNF